MSYLATCAEAEARTKIVELLDGAAPKSSGFFPGSFFTFVPDLI